MISVRVIDPPEPIVKPEDIPGFDAGDAMAETLISAVLGEIDGPTGWLGRCFGPQTLRLSARDWCDIGEVLPYQPFIEVVGVSYYDQNGADTVLPPSYWTKSEKGIIWISNGLPPVFNRSDAIRIDYRAGYNDTKIIEGGTGSIPAQVKVAVMIAVNRLKSASKDDAFLKVDFVDGVGRTEYAVTAETAKVVRDTTESLLFGLKADII